jgi:DNA-binding transcriptional LysR family regulator
MGRLHSVKAALSTVNTEQELRPVSLRLPPLNTLRLFEAAARHCSFKLAAEELHVTPSAVSHSMQTLEAWLGTELFHRSPRGLSLTPAGQSYAPEVRAALSILAAATERVPGRRASGMLSISSAPTFANRWLLPRLMRFTGLYPDVRVTIDTARHYVDLSAEGFDLAIRRGSAPRGSETWIRLTQETIVPVVSPELRESMAACGDMEVLSRAPLIHVTSVRREWDAWFEAKGVAAPADRPAIRVDTMQLAAEGALRGLGIALGRKPLIDEYVAAGSLVEVAGPPVPSDICYWLVGSQLTFERPEAKLFRAWILRELQQDDAAADGNPA